MLQDPLAGKGKLEKERSRMMLKLMFWAIWWLTLLVIEIRSKFEGQNKGGSMVGKNETLGNYHLLMDWWRRTTGVGGKTCKKQTRNRRRTKCYRI